MFPHWCSTDLPDNYPDVLMSIGNRGIGYLVLSTRSLQEFNGLICVIGIVVAQKTKEQWASSRRQQTAGYQAAEKEVLQRKLQVLREIHLDLERRLHHASTKKFLLWCARGEPVNSIM